MSKSKIDFLNQIELKVKDLANEFIKIAVTSGSGTFAGGGTSFAVNTVSGFNAGDDIYIDDKTANSKFTTVYSIVDSTHIKVTGDFHLILSGATIKKTEALQHVNEAVDVFSKYKPLERVKKEIIATPDDVFDLPSDWELGFTLIDKIEYPTDKVPAIFLQEKDFEIFLNDSNVYQLRFKYNVSNSYRLYYIIRHSFDSSNPAKLSAPDTDFYCITNIAAAIYLLALAARYGQSVNPLIGADTVNYDNKVDQYRRLAKVLFGQAAQHLGITVSQLDGTDLEQAPASSSQTVEGQSQDGRELLHDRMHIVNIK